MRHGIEADEGSAIAPLRATARVLRATWDATTARFGAADPVEGLSITGRAIRRRCHFEHGAQIDAAVRRRGQGPSVNLAFLGAELASIAACAHMLLARSIIERRAAELVRADPDVAVHVDRIRRGVSDAVKGERARIRIGWIRCLEAWFASPDADALWLDCAARWGRGPGYLVDVGRRFEAEGERVRLTIDAPSASEGVDGVWDRLTAP